MFRVNLCFLLWQCGFLQYSLNNQKMRKFLTFRTFGERWFFNRFCSLLGCSQWLQCVAPYVGSGCFNLILCPVTISSGETHVPIPNTLVKTWTADGSVLQWDVRVGDRRAFLFFRLSLLPVWDLGSCLMLCSCWLRLIVFDFLEVSLRKFIVYCQRWIWGAS